MEFLYFYIGSLIWYWLVIHYVFKEWKEDVTFFFFIMHSNIECICIISKFGRICIQKDKF